MLVTTHLRSLQAVDLALRTGSLKAAADALGITPAAVGQRIKMLENYLGVDLLARGRSGLQPTEALLQALPHIERAFRELAAAAEALDFQRINEIQIAAPSDWVELWLAPRLPTFKSKHPNILFCINGEGEAALRLGHTDVEVSFGAGRDDDEVLELFHDFVLPVSSPENAARITGGADKRNRLEGFPLLHLDFYNHDPVIPGWQEWIEKNGHRTSPTGSGIRFMRIAPGLEAVLSDAGLMLVGLAMIGDRLKAGDIVLPFALRTGVWTSHYFQARFRKDALVRPQVRRFREWLEVEARQTRDNLKTLVGVSGAKRNSRARSR